MFDKTRNKGLVAETVSVKWPKLPYSFEQEPEPKEFLRISESKKLIKIEPEVIHKEFDDASDELLKEAQEIIDKAPNINEGYLEKLKAAGFTNSPYFNEKNELLKEKEQSELVKSYIEKYRSAYPEYKFITRDKLKAINKKYGLILGPLDRFIKDVPEKNLNDILKAKERIIKGHILKKPILDLPTERLSSIARTIIDHGGIPADMGIIAPLSDFDTSEMIIEDNELKYDVDDPIAVQEVIGGYLIITKWGKEATYEEFK